MKWLDSFRLTVTEKRGFLALAVVLLLLVIIRVVLVFVPDNPEDFQSTLLEEIEIWEEERSAALLVERAFDPNNVSIEFIQNLPINEFAKKNWIKFKEKNNRFYESQDLLAIYGMDTLWFEVNRDSVFISQEKSNSDQEKFVLFQFNPNTASRNDFIKLGVPEWLVERIIKYRNKGGGFRKKEDLKDIYDFPEALYNSLEPFIIIDAIETDLPIPLKVVDLNLCDSIELLEVNGLGPVLSGRIIKRRNMLGGFYAIQQIVEVYGIDEEKLQSIEGQITLSTSILKKNINQLTFKELLAHPYLQFIHVKSIVGYREQIGPIKDIVDLVNLEGFSEKDIERIEPYFSVE